MKSFLISIRPKWSAKILNGEKTAEIRRTAPKEWVDYLSGKTKKKPEPMTGYIYCTQGKPYVAYVDGKLYTQGDGTGRGPADICFNGKVVAKFTLREVERFSKIEMSNGSTAIEGPFKTIIKILKKACLSVEELLAYCKMGDNYAWQISDLVIFDKPKELSEFKEDFQSWVYNRKPRPPFSWQYVEVTV